MAAAPQTVTLYEKGTGKRVELDPVSAQTAYQTGKFGVAKGSVNVVDGDSGEVSHVDSGELASALQSGYRLASGEETRLAERHEKYGGIGGAIKTGIAGLASGASLGATDWVAAALGGDETRQALVDLKEENPWVDTAANVTGAILPAILTEGGSIEGSAAKLGLEGAEELSAGARGLEGAEGLRGAGFTMPGRAAAGEAGSEYAAASRAATEADIAAANAPLSAPTSRLGTVGKYGKGALDLVSAPSRYVGKLGDAVEGGVSSLLGVGADSSATARALAKGAGLGARAAVENAIYKGASSVDEAVLGEDPDFTGEKLLGEMGHAAIFGVATGFGLGAGGHVLGAALKRVGQKAAPLAEKIADEQGWKMFAPTKPMTEAAERNTVGGTRAIGNTARKLLDVSPTDTVEKLAVKATAAKEKLIDQMGDIVAASGVKVKPGPMFEKIDAMIRKAGEDVLSEPIVRKLIDARNSLAEKLGVGVERDGAMHIIGDKEVPIADFLKSRRSLDMAAKEAGAFGANEPKRVVEGLRDIASIVRKVEEEEIMGEGALGKGSPNSAQYKSIKTDVSHLIWMEKAAEKSQTRNMTNQAFSLKDLIGGGIGAELGQHAIGHLAGGALGGPVGFAVGATANHLAREHGRAAAAYLFGKVADLGALRKTVENVDERISDGVEAALAKRAVKKIAKSAAKNAAKSVLKDEYEDRSQQVKEAVAHPYRAAALLEPMSKHAPETTMGLTKAITRATGFLQAKLPAERRDSLTPQIAAKQSPDAMAKFMRYAEIVDDPVKVLDKLADGTLTSEHVEAISTVHPKMYQHMSNELMLQASQRTEPLPMAKDVQMRVFLKSRSGILDPNFVKIMQSSNGPAPSPPQAGSRKGRPTQFKGDGDALMTHAQTITGSGK